MSAVVERAEAEARAALLLVGELLHRSMSVPELLAFADVFASSQPVEPDHPALVKEYAINRAAGQVAMAKLRGLATAINDNRPSPR